MPNNEALHSALLAGASLAVGSQFNANCRFCEGKQRMIYKSKEQLWQDSVFYQYQG